MNTFFINTFLENATAIGKILIVVLVAGVLVRKKILKQSDIKSLSEITVVIFLPALIFSNTILNFDPETIPNWWIIPLVGILMPLLSIAIASLFFLRKLKDKQNLLPLAAIPNAAYLVLPIGRLLFEDNFDQFALYDFLFILGFNPVLWTVGKYLVSYTGEKRVFTIKSIITPPFISNVLAVLIVLTKLHNYIPDLIIEPIRLTGTATVPVATFILGATLGSISLKAFPPIKDISRIVGVKLFLIPTIVFFVLQYLNLEDKLLEMFIMIQASAAPAANLIVIVRKYEGNTQQVGSIMLVAYLLALITMPFWMTLLEVV